MNRNKALLVNSVASLLQQIVALVCGLVVPRLILSTFGSSANGTVASVTQFISITALIQGGITGATRVAFYSPVATKDIHQTSVVHKTSQVFFSRFAFVLSGYILILAIVYPKFVDIPFSTSDGFLLILVLGLNSVFEYLFGMANQLLLFADQKGYINTFLQIICAFINAVVTIALINAGCSLLVVKFFSAMVFVLRPIALKFYVRKKYTLERDVNQDKKVLSQSNAAMAKSIAFYVHTSTDTMVITACLDVMWVSVYAVHRYVVSSISSLVSSVLGNTEALFGQMIARKEDDMIKKDVPLYDLMSKMLSTIFFFTCMILITQFVTLYTGGVTDINYYQPAFAIVLCLAEFVYCTSLTYNNMIMAAGHIKQTQWISITQALINIFSSLILVKMIGIIGVALGTLFAFVFNTVANIVYMRKKIYSMSVVWIVKTYAANVIAGVLAMIVMWGAVDYKVKNYIDFFVYALVTFTVVMSIDVFVNIVFFGENAKKVVRKVLAKFSK